jgi:prepilin-type N-terminal cleavage/methylation domain-containing protein
MSHRLYGHRGFSLTELMLVVAVLATLVGTAVPILQDVNANLKVNEAARLVERELQDARLKAVSVNEPLRLRTNCPAPGMLRIVEVLGTEADGPVTRCDPVAFTFPPADQNIMTRPNFDGPVKLLPAASFVSSATIQFNPDGTANVVFPGGDPAPISVPVTITVSRMARTRSITVNGVGKIQLQ